MTSCSTRELGPRVFVLAGMSCIWFPGFLSQDLLLRHGRGLCSCRALDNIERLIPFPRQQSNMIERADCGAMLAAADALAALGANLAIAIRSSARQKRARVIPEVSTPVL